MFIVVSTSGSFKFVAQSFLELSNIPTLCLNIFNK